MAEALHGRAGADGLTELAHAYRRFARNHPGLYATLLPTPTREEDEEVYLAFAAPVAAIAEVLTGLGVAENDAVSVVRAIRSAIHGFVSLELAGGFGLPKDVDQSFSTLVAVLLGGIEAMGSVGAGGIRARATQ